MKIWGKSVSTEEIKKATYEELVSLINQWNSEDRKHCLERIYPEDYSKSEVEKLRLAIWDKGFRFGCPCGNGDRYHYCCSPKIIPVKDWR
tara:strand:- start:646 stop:915 length:270 start_codon:yes stop_codon:yes gene_type:complete